MAFPLSVEPMDQVWGPLDTSLGRPTPLWSKSSPTHLAIFHKAKLCHPDSELGEAKLDFMYLDELFDMV